MTHTTTMLFSTLALVVLLGCCHGKSCDSDGAPAASTPGADKAAAPANE